MYFTIPISDKEIITDTPLDARSIRSFFIVDRKGNLWNYWNNGFACVSISIDGQDVAKDLFLLPFVQQGSVDHQMIHAPIDSRRIAIRCLKNVNMSEIKISSSNVNLDYEIVFEYSDVEVEEESCEYFETKIFKFFDLSDRPFGIKPINTIFDTEVRTETLYPSKRIFCFSGSVYGDFITSNIDYFGMYNSYNYSPYNMNYGCSSRINIINSLGEAMSELPISMLTPTATTSWKEMQYQFNEEITKYPIFKFTGDTSNLDLYSLFFAAVLSTDIKL